MIKYVLKNPGEEPQVIETESLDKEELKAIVTKDGYPQYIPCHEISASGKVSFVVDDEGIPRGLTRNALMLQFTPSPKLTWLYGSIAVVRYRITNVGTDDEKEIIESLTDDEADEAMYYFSYEGQKKLLQFS